MSGPRRHAESALAAAFLALCSLYAAAQDAAPLVLEVLDCRVAHSLPAPPAVASEGGFAFAFESLGGTAADGRACTVYRLRNLAGSPPTPVRWVAGSDVLVDGARLARCGEEGDCAWFEVARYFEGDVVDGNTVLGYGLNADSFHAVTPGLVGFPAPDVGAAAASVGTELVGVLVDSEGNEVRLDLVVKSRFERTDSGLTLVYEATSDDPGQLDGRDFVLAWEALDLLLDPAGGLGGPFASLATGARVPATHAEEGAVSVRVPAGSAVFRDLLRLTVREPGADGDALLTVMLPAFLPEH